MNREIKFRVWTGDNSGRMEYDVTVGRFGAFYVNPGAKGDGLDEHDSASLTPLNTKYDERIPVMQYSGLKDKNGKEIYEGDILKDRYGDIKPLEWKPEQGTFEVFNFPYYDDPEDCEIIGNIYSNPDLITPTN